MLRATNPKEGGSCGALDVARVDDEREDPLPGQLDVHELGHCWQQTASRRQIGGSSAMLPLIAIRPGAWLPVADLTTGKRSRCI